MFSLSDRTGVSSIHVGCRGICVLSSAMYLVKVVVFALKCSLTLFLRQDQFVHLDSSHVFIALAVLRPVPNFFLIEFSESTI